ncbi:MAG: RnfABCDGE type electron transport complex subunit D [Oscillospiraceae bacterium]|nr:RnfABCDGE type electron transport complex subunit D [Oscillospiraceae bacterium]
MEETRKLIVSSSPHIRTPRDTKAIMLDVLIALIPALVASLILFGVWPLVLTAVSVVSCVVFEFLYRKLLKKPNTVGDLSAVVTGVLLAYTLPTTAPWWLPVIGAFFAIVIVKQLFGGLGKNFLNPALAGRAFLVASYAVLMTTWKAANFESVADAATYATPLASLHQGTLSSTGIGAMLLGNTGGCVGEVCSIALLLGGAYLVVRKVISLRIPLSFILTVAVVTFIFPRGNNNFLWMLQNVFSGGLLLGAIFMATDYCTSPVTPKGQVIFGIGCGLITVLIRYFGSYPEGVSYAILVMNLTVWMIDKRTAPRRFGVPGKSFKLKRAGKDKKKEEAKG